MEPRRGGGVILRKEDGDLDAKDRLDVNVLPGRMKSWWARFPALAADTDSFDLVVPPAPPFDGIPILAQ